MAGKCFQLISKNGGRQSRCRVVRQHLRHSHELLWTLNLQVKMILDMVFSISAGRLFVRTNRGDSFSISATSGRGPCMNNATCQSIPSEGPLPMGFYTASSKNLTENSAWTLAHGDWGDWRVALKPDPSTHTHGRSGFYIHGGFKGGSAGCIDIGGGIFGDEQTDRLKFTILASEFVSVEVRQ